MSEVNRESSLEGFDNPLVAAYYDYAVELAVLLGADKDTAITELREVVEFEKEIAKVSIINFISTLLSCIYNT